LVSRSWHDCHDGNEGGCGCGDADGRAATEFSNRAIPSKSAASGGSRRLDALAAVAMAGVSLSSATAVSTVSTAAVGAETEGGSISRFSKDMNEDERSKSIWSLLPSKTPLKRARLSETMPAMRSSMHCWLTWLGCRIVVPSWC
jgi:hypothetical protein